MTSLYGDLRGRPVSSSGCLWAEIMIKNKLTLKIGICINETCMY